MSKAEGQSERLAKAAKEAGLKGPTDVARISDLNPITVSAYMRGTRQASLEACYAMATALGVDPFWLFDGRDKNSSPTQSKKQSWPGFAKDRKNIGQINSRQQIPLYTCAISGKDDGVATSPIIIDYIEAPDIVDGVEGAYAVRVSGEQMEPRFLQGETLFVHPRVPVRRLDYVVAEIYDDSVEGGVQGYIKKFISLDDSHLTLENLNPAKKLKFPRDKVKSIGRIAMILT